MMPQVNTASNPTVSVVIPTCNRSELLQRAVASVLAQTFQDFEIIVVDDGEVAPAPFADSRIRYSKNDTKKGASASRNRGIHEARAGLIAFLDDDDQWVPEKLEIQLAYLKQANPETVFCFSAVRNIHDDHEYITHVMEHEGNFLDLALSKFNGFLTSTLIIKRESLLTIGGFDESLPSHQEPELIIRLSEKYDGVGIDEPLTLMSMERSHEHIGSDLSRMIAGREILIAKHAVLFSERPKVLAKHCFQIGLWHRDSGNVREARRFFIKAFFLSWNPRYLLHSLAILGKTKAKAV